jgi:hypothetical protein
MTGEHPLNQKNHTLTCTETLPYWENRNYMGKQELHRKTGKKETLKKET